MYNTTEFVSDEISIAFEEPEQKYRTCIWN